MVKNHSDNKRGNLLPPLHGLLFPISSKGSYARSHKQDSTYHGLCYGSRGALAERGADREVGKIRDGSGGGGGW